MDHCEKLKLYDLVKSDDNIVLLRKLLALGVDPNLENSHKETLLHMAAKSTEENIGIVQELINKGADADRCNNFKYKPLHFAVIYRKRRVVEALLQSRICINSQDSFKKTALHYAVNNNYPCCVHFRDIPLHARVPDLWIVRKLLDHSDINVNERDKSLETPLMQAVKDKHLEIVKLLLNQDSKLDASNEDGQTPLHIALSHEDPCPYIVVQLLLKRATLLKMNKAYNSPLDIIINSKSIFSARICLRVIAFNYHIKELLINKLQRIPELSQFLKKCYDEINKMKGDIIENEFTVFNFLVNYSPKSVFYNPILQIFKPVVEKIITGGYPEYFCYILHRISKSNLSAVLKAAVVEKYCKENCDVKDCKNEHFTGFSLVLRMGLLTDYLSSWDIFCLIWMISRVKIDEYMLNIHKHECFLTDSWEEHPDKDF